MAAPCDFLVGKIAGSSLAIYGHMTEFLSLIGCDVTAPKVNKEEEGKMTDRSTRSHIIKSLS